MEINIDEVRQVAEMVLCDDGEIKTPRDFKRVSTYTKAFMDYWKTCCGPGEPTLHDVVQCHMDGWLAATLD